MPSLPTEERADPGAADAWLAEIERRTHEVESGAASLEDWATVRARWAARWRKPLH